MHICTPSEFLTALWGPTPHTRILVWTMSERRSHWLRDPKEADRAWDGDTYTGAALPGPTVKLEDNVRGEAKQAGAITGLWVDVDYEDEHAHRKANLPSFIEARDFVQGVDPTPTITVRSGHGYQVAIQGRPVGIQVRHRARGSRATVRTLAERTPPAARQGAGFHTRCVPSHEVLPTTAYHSVRSGLARVCIGIVIDAPPGAASGGVADAVQQRMMDKYETARTMRAHYEASFSTFEGPAKGEGAQVLAAEMQVASWQNLLEALQANASTLPESAVTVLGGQDALLDHLAGFIELYCDRPFGAKTWEEELLPDMRRLAVQATEDARQKAQAQLLKRGAALQQLAFDDSLADNVV